ncbi:MAG: Nif3-like dinuclear metal center hexameric protein [Clostridium sp.]|nr:Nif3-like dinuclear metal center hexameric protein [Clostridium sp.]
MRIRDILNAIEAEAPLSIQEDWDNSGLQVGDAGADCRGVLLCVDCTEAIIDEAVARGYNLVISHHPLIFRGLKRLTGSIPAERVAIRAIASGIAIYSSHTALDSASYGVSRQMAEMLGLEDIAVLEPRMNDQLKLTVFVPAAKLEEVRLALFDAGAGTIGRYDSCSWSTQGEGTFRPLEGSEPAVGEVYAYHSGPEVRLEMLLPRWRRGAVENALRQVHPYEEPAYEFTAVETGSNPNGLGCIGNLPKPMTPREIALMAKERFGCQGIRASRFDGEDTPGEEPVRYRRVALCGGAGGSLIGRAISLRAQIMITADLRYHDFVDLSSQIALVDIGHFDSEQCARDIFYRIISEKFPNFAVGISKNEINPIQYL